VVRSCSGSLMPVVRIAWPLSSPAWLARHDTKVSFFQTGANATGQAQSARSRAPLPSDR
jgi:hypothetical protein